MLANISEADDYAGEIRPLPDDAPVRRIGLEQEFFVVDRKGEPRDLADLLLRECREAARAEGLDPRCFKAECAKGLVEIATPPSPRLAGLIEDYLNSLGLALRVASELGLALYPLGTYPLPISPLLRDDPGYAAQSQHHRAREVLARWQVRRGAPASGVARGHGMARREGGA